MVIFSRVILGFVISIISSVILNNLLPDAEWIPIVSTIVMIAWWIFGWPKRKSVLASEKEEAVVDVPNPNGALYVLDSFHDVLEVFDFNVTITPKKTATAMFVRGLKGTKSIPYSSITAVQFRKANPMNGYIQFSMLGGNEAKGGVIDAISDENTVFFVEKHNQLAVQIRDYIEGKIFKQAITVPQDGLADQLTKLAELNSKGMLTDSEFAAAKEKIFKS